MGDEIKAYRRAQNMVKPVREGRRCWVLSYADGAMFHMDDIVPAVPNAAQQRPMLEARGLDLRWSDTAIVITDIRSPVAMSTSRTTGSGQIQKATPSGSDYGWARCSSGAGALSPKLSRLVSRTSPTIA